MFFGQPAAAPGTIGVRDEFNATNLNSAGEAVQGVMESADVSAVATALFGNGISQRLNEGRITSPLRGGH